MRYSLNKKWDSDAQNSNIKLMLTLLVTVSLFLLNSCASVSIVPPSSASSLKTEKREADRAQKLSPPKLRLKGMIAYNFSGGRKREAPLDLSTKIKSIVVKESDVKEVVNILFKESDLNVVFGEGVKGVVNLSYKNMTVEEILESMLSSNGYLYTINKDYIWIGRIGTKVFTLNLAPDGEVNVWQSIEEELDKLKTQEGRIIINPNAGTIMVTDNYDSLSRIEAYIDMV